jgi:nucleoside-diphosphate-sugar epimerase
MLLVTGITGLTGKFLYQEIQKSFHQQRVRYFLHKGSDPTWMHGEDIVYGDLSNIGDIEEAMEGVQWVLHLAPRGQLIPIVEACKRRGVGRLYYINSTGVYSKFKSSTHFDITNEKHLKKSDLIYTIIRPSMIYGNHQDRNIHLLTKLIDRFKIFPIIGKGQGLMHPIYAKDLAKVIVTALQREEITRFKSYDVAGKYPLPYKQLLETIANALGKRRIFIHIPYTFAKWVGKLGDRIPNRLISYEKVLRLEEDKNFDYSDAKRDLDFDPLSFEEAIGDEIEALKIVGIIQ